MSWLMSGEQHGADPSQQQVSGTSSPSGSDQGRLAADFALQHLLPTPRPSPTAESSADVRPAPAHHHTHLRLAGRLVWGQVEDGGYGGSTESQMGESGETEAGPVDGGGTTRPTEAERDADGGPDAADIDTRVDTGSAGPVPVGRRSRTLMPLPYVRPRARGNDRCCRFGRSGASAEDHLERGDLGTGECRPRPPPQSCGLDAGPAQTAAWLTDDDSDSSASDQLCPLSGEAAWARCWRLAPQMAEWAAVPWSVADGSGTTRSVSTLEAGGAAEGCAGADRVSGSVEDEAEAGIEVLGRTEEEAKNAGDSVDMALRELSARFAAR